MSTRGEIFSTKITANDRTYFFNVKENRRGDKFLNLVESKKNLNNTFDRHQIIIFEEDIDNFMEQLTIAIEEMKK